jgi:hypothetical protein
LRLDFGPAQAVGHGKNPPARIRQYHGSIPAAGRSMETKARAAVAGELGALAAAMTKPTTDH